MSQLLKIIGFVALLGSLVPCGAFAQEVQTTGTVRTGMEWDDNVLRTEGEERVSDFLARYFTSVGIGARVFERGTVVFDATHGGKFFVSEAESDELLTALALIYQQRFTPWLGLYAQLDMKDRTERISFRDYNRGGASAGLDFRFSDFVIRAGVGARYFAFKPAPDASSSSAEGQLRLAWEVIPNLRLGAGYTLARRAFDTNRFVLDEDGVFMDEKALREDQFQVVQAFVSWRGPVVLEGSYVFSQNDSNSYGQELTRQGVDVVATAPLLWNFFASLRLEVQRTTYGDPVLIDADFLLDEDNRNSLVGSLARTFGDSWEAEVRYSLYLQEFGVGSDYRRQTVMLAMGYLFE